jgi:UTP-glucose-1-phosphate uridylyltransferase
MNKTLVIMAAGAGSRFGGPKQTTPVGPHGEWLLDYALFDAQRAGFDRAVCIIRPELEPDFRQLSARVGRAIETSYVTQRLDDLPAGHAPGDRTKPWGTGHAVLSVREVVKTPFAVMNADDFYGADAYRLGGQAADLAGRKNVASVIAMRLDNTLSPFGPVKRGWCQTRDGRVTRLEEVMGIAREGDKLVAQGRHAGTGFTGSELVSMNFWVFPVSVFSLLAEKFGTFLRASGGSADEEFLLPEVINELIAERRLDVHAEEAPGPWFGLTYQEDKAEVMSGLADLTNQGVYPSSMWSR